MTEFSSTYQPENEAKRKPKRGRIIKDALMLALEREADVEGKLTRKIVAMADALVDKAVKGDVQAFNAVCDRIEGKPVQAVEMTGADGGPIQTEDVNARDIIAGRILSLASRLGAEGDTGKPH